MPMLRGLFRRPSSPIFLPPSQCCFFSNLGTPLWRHCLSPFEAAYAPVPDCPSIFFLAV